MLLTANHWFINSTKIVDWDIFYLCDQFLICYSFLKVCFVLYIAFSFFLFRVRLLKLFILHFYKLNEEPWSLTNDQTCKKLFYVLNECHYLILNVDWHQDWHCQVLRDCHCWQLVADWSLKSYSVVDCWQRHNYWIPVLICSPVYFVQCLVCPG